LEQVENRLSLGRGKKSGTSSILKCNDKSSSWQQSTRGIITRYELNSRLHNIYESVPSETKMSARGRQKRKLRAGSNSWDGLRSAGTFNR
jgi:hypothetical protein